MTFSEVKGMEALNGCEPRKVTTKGERAIRKYRDSDIQALTPFLLGTLRVLAPTRVEVSLLKSRCPRSSISLVHTSPFHHN